MGGAVYVLVFGRLCSISSLFFFFFKQKTAYEMRISDWSSDVCSSDLMTRTHGRSRRGERLYAKAPFGKWRTLTFLAALRHDRIDEIGRASCRERVCQYV